MNQRPEKNEYAEFYAGYVALVPDADIIAALENQTDDLRNSFAEIAPDRENYRYAPGKWSVKEMLGHLNDGERVFAYRALRFSRGDETPVSGFEENFYVANGNFEAARFAELLEEFTLLRGANVRLFKNLTDEQWRRRGTASGAPISVRALAFIMVGHVRHHQNVLRERYSIFGE